MSTINDCQGLLEPLEVVKWKWEHVMMNFVFDFFPKSTRGNEAIWVMFKIKI